MIEHFNGKRAIYEIELEKTFNNSNSIINTEYLRKNISLLYCTYIFVVWIVIFVSTIPETAFFAPKDWTILIMFDDGIMPGKGYSHLEHIAIYVFKSKPMSLLLEIRLT